jgi:nitroimidazol reductase NimA-like FMN-containing flavoprotein (pyridoxamine 5'-phosphate oxidase superfamily)
VHTLTDYLPRFRHGRPDGFVGVMTDVTRQTRAERAHAAEKGRLDELRQRTRAAAGMSDDVLQELFAIGLHLERMRRFRDEELEEAGPVVEILSRSVDRLRESIRQLVGEGHPSGQVGTIGPEPTGTTRPTVVGPGTSRKDGPAVTGEEPVIELSLDECWDMLEADEFGRLAYRLVDEVHLVPINYAVDDRSLLFRTASGSKLLAAALHSDVALEIDWHDDLAAWSVVARGQLRRLPEDQLYRMDALPRQPWIPTLTYDVVELVPTAVTGRRFRLQRPEPDHALADA